MFSYYQTLLIIAVPLALIIAAPFFRFLLFRGRFGNGQDWRTHFQLKPAKLPWATVALLLSGMIFQYFPLCVLAILSVPLIYRFRSRTAE